jgi:hypothetical protein
MLSLTVQVERNPSCDLADDLGCHPSLVLHQDHGKQSYLEHGQLTYRNLFWSNKVVALSTLLFCHGNTK